MINFSVGLKIFLKHWGKIDLGCFLFLFFGFFFSLFIIYLFG